MVTAISFVQLVLVLVIGITIMYGAHKAKQNRLEEMDLSLYDMVKAMVVKVQEVPYATKYTAGNYYRPAVEYVDQNSQIRCVTVKNNMLRRCTYVPGDTIDVLIKKDDNNTAYMLDDRYYEYDNKLMFYFGFIFTIVCSICYSILIVKSF